jgi:antitoxin ParD1/3/4
MEESVMEITLKPDTERLVREKVDRGDFKDASDLVDEAIRYLLEMDRAEAELETLVRQGIESGPATEMTPADLEDIRSELHAKHSRNR